LDAGFKAICTHRRKARWREPADFVILELRRAVELPTS
jgi:hypothetical protein